MFDILIAPLCRARTHSLPLSLSHAPLSSRHYYLHRLLPLVPLSTSGWMEFLTLANPFTYALRHTLEMFPVLLYLCRPFRYRYYSLLFIFPLFLFLAFKYETNLRRWIDDQELNGSNLRLMLVCCF